MEESTSNQENKILNIEEHLSELYNSGILDTSVYYSLLDALDRRINIATKTGILMATNSLKPVLEELINNASKIN